MSEQAQAIADTIKSKGVFALETEPSASFRAAIGKALGNGTYASFYVPGVGLTYMTHEWIRDHIDA